MNNIKASPFFKRKLKPLLKKYFTLQENIEILGEKLIENPYLGESYGNNIYKVRLADKSKGGGKSGGFRILYYLAFQKGEDINIILMTIFSKSELDTIKKKDADLILIEILKELDRNI